MTTKNEHPHEERPKKLYYSISEVAEIAGVKAHVLRYWESEFPSLKPRKTRGGSRRYRPADIDEVLKIRELLYEQGFKIAGARKALREAGRTRLTVDTAPGQLALGFEALSDAERMAFIKNELDVILKLLGEMQTAGVPDQLKKMEGKG